MNYSQWSVWESYNSRLVITLTIISHGCFNLQLVKNTSPCRSPDIMKTKCHVNQLPRLSGRWVPGIPRGFHCQPLDRQLPPWLANPRTVVGRKIGMGGGEDAKWTAPKTTTQMLKEELADLGRVQSYHKPCEPALMGLTAGCPLRLWAAWLLNLWTAKLVDHLTAKLVKHLTATLVNRLTAKLVDRLTAKIVVVNLVKLHLTK